MDLQQIQKGVQKISTKNGFDEETLEQKFMLLFEEVGELAKSVRNFVGTKVGKHSKKFEAGQEASDVLYVLIDICNKLGIDLKNSFNKKLTKIKTRYK